MGLEQVVNLHSVCEGERHWWYERGCWKRFNLCPNPTGLFWCQLTYILAAWFSSHIKQHSLKLKAKALSFQIWRAQSWKEKDLVERSFWLLLPSEQRRTTEEPLTIQSNIWQMCPFVVRYSQSFLAGPSGSALARLSVLDTLIFELSKLLPRCNLLICLTTAVALNACWKRLAVGRNETK